MQKLTGMDVSNKEFIIDGAATIGRARYQTTVKSGGHTIVVDEPLEDGGADVGMSPYRLLLSSLASCTAITLRMYIDRKMWPVEDITVHAEMFRTPEGILIDTKLSFKGELDHTKRKRLITIADACPIHKILIGSIAINTSIDA